VPPQGIWAEGVEAAASTDALANALAPSVMAWARTVTLLFSIEKGKANSEYALLADKKVYLLSGSQEELSKLAGKRVRVTVKTKGTRSVLSLLLLLHPKSETVR
jgi:hypothetical protein